MTQGRQLRLAVQSRVIVDNDWAGDPDGLVALAHHLLSPTNRVVAVSSSLLNPMFGELGTTAARGAELARELVDLIGGSARPVVHVGAEAPFQPGGAASPASEAIIAEARRDDDLPLHLVCAGPLTNVAAALDRAPEIASRLTLVWVGGSRAADVFEYNRDTDPRAAEFVLGLPELRIWQFPVETYRRCAYSVAELEHDLVASGRVGSWLWDRFLDLPLPDWLEHRAVWPLGDSPPVLVTALTDESSTWTTPDGGTGARRVYTDVDFRLVVGDMLARLRLHEARQAPAD